MTRIVRFEELDGQLILRVPEDVAKRLGFVAGTEAVLRTDANRLVVDPMAPEGVRQLKIGLRIMDEHRDVLARLAKS